MAESFQIMLSLQATDSGGKRMSLKRIDLLICCGSGCVSAGALKVKEQFHSVLKKRTDK